MSGLEHDALKDEISERIREIDRTAFSAGVCPSHEAIARGVCTLLRCQIAGLDERAEARKERKEAFWKTVGVATPIAGLLASIIMHYWK